MSRKGNKKKWLRIGAGVFALVIVAGAFVSGMVYGDRNGDPLFGNGQGNEEQGKDDETKKPDDIGEPVALGGGMFLSIIEGEESLVSLYSAELPRAAYAANDVPETAENSYVVTATVEPDNYATNSAIEWSAAWESGRFVYDTSKGHYATEIDQYVQITPQGDDYMLSKVATVTCLQSFGEPIILTAACKYDKSLTATIRIDYAARFTIMQYQTMEERDAEGNNHVLTWGKNEIPFELGTASTIVNYFPSRIMFMTEGYSTLDEEYTLTLKHVANDFEPIGVGAYAFSPFETKTATLGTITVNKKTGSDIPAYAGVTLIPHGEEQNFRFGASGIGQNWIGYYGQQSYNTNMYELCRYMSGESLQYEIEKFNNCIELNKDINGEFHFSDIILEIKSPRVTYTKKASIYLTKAIASVNLSGVSIEGGNVIL